MNDELTIRESTAPLAERDADIMGVSLDLLKARVEKIHQLMDQVMRDGQHYGVIPGTTKPTLLQPGAQMLCTMFRFTPKADVTMRDLGNGHREYQIVTHVYSSHGTYLGFGVGSCSTMETRYRYRQEKGKMTVVGEVPKAYWGLRDKSPDKAQAMIGPGNRTKKLDDGKWAVVHYEGGGARVENPDIADVYNTCLKIASKRSLVSGVLNTTGASDVFTQDMEDLKDTLAASGSGITTETKTEEDSRWSSEQADVVAQIREAIPDWMKDTSVAAKRLSKALDDCEKSDDLGPIQAIFEYWVKGIFPALERLRKIGEHRAFDAKKDREKVQGAMKVADYDLVQLESIADIWEEQLARRLAKQVEGSPDTSKQDAQLSDEVDLMAPPNPND